MQHASLYAFNWSSTFNCFVLRVFFSLASITSIASIRFPSLKSFLYSFSRSDCLFALCVFSVLRWSMLTFLSAMAAHLGNTTWYDTIKWSSCEDENGKVGKKIYHYGGESLQRKWCRVVIHMFPQCTRGFRRYLWNPHLCPGLNANIVQFVLHIWQGYLTFSY